ncbi:hypothetical protein CRUP_018985 [Coryphaenoides rupestris]|nr:hypothetical protein CRUP_018985 [Coryphaenoides rupestris]
MADNSTHNFKFVVVGGGIAGVTCVEQVSSDFPAAEVALITAASHIKAVANFKQFVVVGGGIAGVTCVEQVSSDFPAAEVALITAASHIKAVANFKQVSRTLEEFDVEERPTSVLQERFPNITVIQSAVTSLCVDTHTLRTEDGRTVGYEKLCICSGARPKLLSQDQPYVLGVRDTESVLEIQKRLSSAKRILVVGNGGIALELVFEVGNCEVVWAVKDRAIGTAFFDAGAAHFLVPALAVERPARAAVCKRARYTTEEAPDGGLHTFSAGADQRRAGAGPTDAGSALGPDWHEGFLLRGAEQVGNCEVVWAVKDRAIGTAFFDAGAAHFLVPALAVERPARAAVCKRARYTTEEAPDGGLHTFSAGADQRRAGAGPTDAGSALGPDWHEGFLLRGAEQYECEVQEIFTSSDQQRPPPPPELDDGSWPVYVLLTNGKTVGCDFIFALAGDGGLRVDDHMATSEPDVYAAGDFALAGDGGLRVDDHMATSEPDVYAAGDVCSACWEPSPWWQQMRLWTQARQMGWFAARCIAANVLSRPIELDFCFEVFAHITKFFSYKVVLLGKFNAQGLGADHELLVVLREGRMVGAVLIGETDLEETFENLILNQMDLTPYREELLNPNIDIEDYFD